MGDADREDVRVAGPPWGSLVQLGSPYLKSALSGSLCAIRAAGAGRAEQGHLFSPHSNLPLPHPDTKGGSKGGGDGWSTG